MKIFLFALASTFLVFFLMSNVFAGSNDNWIICGSSSYPIGSSYTLTQGSSKTTYYCCNSANPTWQTTSCSATTTTYTAEFDESGLPSGTTWTITVSNSTWSSTQSATVGSGIDGWNGPGTSIYFTGLVGSGSYSWYAPTISCGTGCQYVGSSGSFSSQTNTVTVSYPKQYQLTMSVSPSGGGTTSPAVGSYWKNDGQTVSISATANSGYQFSSWAGSGSGSYTGTNNPTSVTMNGPITETANFANTTAPFDFSISLNPTSGTVQQGGNTSSTVTVSLVNGTTQTVNLSVSNCPPNASCPLSTTSGNPTYTSTLTISTSSSTPTGSYTITVTGTGGGKTHSASYTLTVQSPFDFSISTNPTSSTVNQGQTASTTTTLNLTLGSTQSVSLSYSGCPTGANCGFSLKSCSPTCSSIFSVATTSSTPTGTYSITLTGNGGGKTHSTTYTLTVQSVQLPQTYNATFSESGLPSGTTWGVTVGGTRYTTSSTSQTVSGLSGTVSYSYDSTISGGSGTQYVCNSGCSGSVSSTSSSASASYTTQYQLTMSVSPSGAGTTSPAVGSYWKDAGQPVQISATANSGYQFSSWAGSGSGSYTGTNNTTSVTMNGPITEQATFVNPSLSCSPPGSICATGSCVLPSGYTCGSGTQSTTICSSTNTCTVPGTQSCTVGCPSGQTCSNGQCVSTTCSGTPTLSLSPNPTTPSSTVTASSSGLSSGCNGQTLTIKDYNGCTSGTTITSCTISNGGCSATFTAPSSPGQYGYYACASSGSSQKVILTVQTTPTTGTISGSVTTASGSGISGATVTCTGPTTVSGTTDSTGSYTINNVPAGTYTCTVSVSGYTSQSQTVTVNSGQTTTVNFVCANGQCTATTPTTTGTVCGNGVCEWGETQLSCPQDCKTTVSVSPSTNLYPGEYVNVIVAFNDSRFNFTSQPTHNVFVNLVIDPGTASQITWTSCFNQNITMSNNMMNQNVGIYQITTSNGYARISATCVVPSNVVAGTHVLQAAPIIYTSPIVLMPATSELIILPATVNDWANSVIRSVMSIFTSFTSFAKIG